MLFPQAVRLAASRACCTAGSNMAIKMPTIAITTNSSINVNPSKYFRFLALISTHRASQICGAIRKSPMETPTCEPTPITPFDAARLAGLRWNNNVTKLVRISRTGLWRQERKSETDLMSRTIPRQMSGKHRWSSCQDESTVRRNHIIDSHVPCSVVDHRL